jgi:sugar phosphate isomerase/epimerase
LKGPGVFIGHFLRPEAPFGTLDGIARWASGLGFRGVELPVHDARIIDMQLAAESATYAQEVTGRLAEFGLEITEFCAHRTAFQLARHEAYAHADVGGAVGEAAAEILRTYARACRNLGPEVRCGVVSGALAFCWLFPWPVRDASLVADAFAELGRRWKPVLDYYDDQGVDLCFEPHTGCDVHDGTTFERFYELVGHHPRCRMMFDPSHLLLQQMDIAGFAARYATHIVAFHVKDAEFLADARSGLFGGFLMGQQRPARYRAAGRGQIDFPAVFSALHEGGYKGWATLEWEDPSLDAETAAREGAGFIMQQLGALTPPPA